MHILQDAQYFDEIIGDIDQNTNRAFVKTYVTAVPRICERYKNILLSQTQKKRAAIGDHPCAVSSMYYNHNMYYNIIFAGVCLNPK